MKKFGFAAIALSALGVGLFGLAGPAQAAAPAAHDAVTISAGVDHISWLDQVEPKDNVPQIHDRTVRLSGR